MPEIVSHILAADTFSYVIVGILALMAAAVIQSTTSSLSFAALYLPAIAFGGLAGIYAVRAADIPLSHDVHTDVVLSAAAGTLAGLAVMMALTRLIHTLIRIRKPVTTQTRRQYRA
jgi:predicted membrane channel-forming protein YqfA (hemolysin III family)